MRDSADAMKRRLVVVATAVVAAAGVAGCGSLAAREDAAGSVAARFEAALQARNGAGACRFLAPNTRQQLERSARARCAGALTDAVAGAARSPGKVRQVDVYGDQARAVFARDTVFLAEFSTGWRITAADCHSGGSDRPYDCTVKGG